MKKKFRDIIVNEENYEWSFSGVVHIRENNNNSINLTIDIGWYDVWLYIHSLPPDDCELWKVTPSFVKEAILFALDKGWKKEHKQLYLKYKNKNFKVVENQNKIPDLEAEIYYLKTEEGGKNGNF